MEYLAYWGYAASVVTLIVAILGPTLGTLADTGGYKKPIFAVFAIAGMIGCISLGFVSGWFAFIVLFVIAKTGYSGSLIFYDSMLGDITSEDRMDNVSSNGYAWGYLGSCVPFIISLVIVLFYESLGHIYGHGDDHRLLHQQPYGRAAFTMPLLSSYRQINHADKEKGAVRDGIARLVDTFRNMRKNRRIFSFCWHSFSYIDGVYTIIDMATAYGSALGLDQTGLLLALLVTQIVAFPFAILFGRLASRYRSEDLITVCIAAYFGIAVLCDIPNYAGAVLGAGGVRRYVSGRHTGVVQIVFHEDNTAQQIGRIFRPHGYMRQRSGVYRNYAGEFGFSRYGRYKQGRGNDIRTISHRYGILQGSGQRGQTSGKYGRRGGYLIVCGEQSHLSLTSLYHKDYYACRQRLRCISCLTIWCA